MIYVQQAALNLPSPRSPSTFPRSLVVIVAVSIAVVVLILEEEVFVGAVYGEGDGGGAQSGESALVSVPSGEGALVPPSLTVSLISTTPVMCSEWRLNARSLPGVVFRLTGGVHEGSHVEAGDVGLGPALGGS